MSEYSSTLALVVIFVGIVVYFLPAYIASGRAHPNTYAIALLNLFLGWTGIGWVAALIWSASSINRAPSESPAAPEVAVEPDKYAKLERIAQLKERGALTDMEFQAEKSKILSS